MAEAESEVWEFRRDLEAPDEVWTWRCKVGGVVERQSEAPFLGIGKAIADAVLNGFAPSKHTWVLSDKEFSSYFSPGAEPRIVRRDPPTNPPKRK